MPRPPHTLPLHAGVQHSSPEGPWSRQTVCPLQMSHRKAKPSSDATRDSVHPLLSIPAFRRLQQVKSPSITSPRAGSSPSSACRHPVTAAGRLLPGPTEVSTFQSPGKAQRTARCRHLKRCLTAARSAALYAPCPSCVPGRGPLPAGCPAKPLPGGVYRRRAS